MMCSCQVGTHTPTPFFTAKGVRSWIPAPHIQPPEPVKGPGGLYVFSWLAAMPSAQTAALPASLTIMFAETHDATSPRQSAVSLPVESDNPVDNLKQTAHAPVRNCSFAWRYSDPI